MLNEKLLICSAWEISMHIHTHIYIHKQISLQILLCVHVAQCLTQSGGGGFPYNTNHIPKFVYKIPIGAWFNLCPYFYIHTNWTKLPVMFLLQMNWKWPQNCFKWHGTPPRQEDIVWTVRPTFPDHMYSKFYGEYKIMEALEILYQWVSFKQDSVND